jgi:hypothetical protein
MLTTLPKAMTFLQLLNDVDMANVLSPKCDFQKHVELVCPSHLVLSRLYIMH